VKTNHFRHQDVAINAKTLEICRPPPVSAAKSMTNRFHGSRMINHVMALAIIQVPAPMMIKLSFCRCIPA
jgi:hypothetical protein